MKAGGGMGVQMTEVQEEVTARTERSRRGFQWLEQLDGYGVGLKILTQDIDTTSSAGRLMFTVLAAVAEMERELIRERVKAGVERARSEGRQLGRPPRSAVEDLRRWPDVRTR